MMQESQQLRPSQYFGALHIDKLDENELPDPKLTQLFEECFGKKFVRPPTPPFYKEPPRILMKNPSADLCELAEPP